MRCEQLFERKNGVRNKSFFNKIKKVRVLYFQEEMEIQKKKKILKLFEFFHIVCPYWTFFSQLDSSDPLCLAGLQGLCVEHLFYESHPSSFPILLSNF